MLILFQISLPDAFNALGKTPVMFRPEPDPDRIAGRILGMGDVLSLVEEVTQKVDQEKAAKLAKKISKGKSFTLEDFKDPDSYATMETVDKRVSRVQTRSEAIQKMEYVPPARLKPPL